MRPPSVTQMKRTSFSGQLRNTPLTLPRRSMDRYMPRGPRKMWPNFRHASPMVGSYTIGRKRAGSDMMVR